MNPPLTPSTLGELSEAIRSASRVIAVGGGTKPRLSHVDATRISTSGLSGIIEYDPEEFTFTAMAGTPVWEIATTLKAHGQYLPFDPMLGDAGATIGGTVASGLSGPGRMRYGGVRDFIIGIRMVDGTGRVLRMGGKVVKNAAGFDLPKFMTGSLGRLGVLGEVTFKVFPRPVGTRTYRLQAGDPPSVRRILEEAGRSRFELDALDVPPDGSGILARIAAPEPALEGIGEQLLSRWRGEVLEESEASMVWRNLAGFAWADSGSTLARVPITSEVVPEILDLPSKVPGTLVHISSGGNVAFIAFFSSAALDGILRQHSLVGMSFRGEGPLWLGKTFDWKIAEAVKTALDPEHRFPNFND